MNSHDQERAQFEAWFSQSGMEKFKETAWAAWQARAQQPASVAVPEGFRIMKPTGSALRDGDRWEVYSLCGGGIVSGDDVKDWVVRDLLDALAAAPNPACTCPTLGAQDVSGLVEALEWCQSWFEKHCPTSKLDGYFPIVHPMLTSVRNALAAHRAQQDKQ